MFCVEHSGVVPDVMTVGKVSAMASVTGLLVRGSGGEPGKSAPTGYGGNPIACAALASIEVIEEEGLVERSALLGTYLLARLREIQERHPIVGHGTRVVFRDGTGQGKNPRALPEAGKRFIKRLLPVARPGSCRTKPADVTAPGDVEGGGG